MIKVELPSRLLGIAFSHPTVQKLAPVFKMSGPMMMSRRTTHCEVYELSADSSIKPNLVAHAIVNVHYKDNFNRATGRKIALTRALKFMNLTKLERATVWEAYHNRGVEGLVLELEREMRKGCTADVEYADAVEVAENEGLGG